MTDGADKKHRTTGEEQGGRRDADASDAIDPAMIERLEAWFAGPATGFPPPAAEKPKRALPPEGPQPPEDDRQRQRERAIAAVDPRLLERLERQGDRSASMLEPLPPPKLTPDAGIAGFDFSVWGLQGIGDPREIERPDDIQHAVQERTPQAVLRDLHRPVRWYGDVVLRPVDMGIDRYGVQARAAIADLVCQRRYRVDPHREPNGRRILKEEAAEIREILGQPWENSKPAEPRPVPSGFPDENDLRWFGSIGVDPDQ